MVSDHRRAGPDIKLLAGRKLFRGSFHRLANREEKGGKVLKDFERWSPRPANFVVPFFSSSSPSCFCCRRCFRFESYSFLTDIRQVCNFRVYFELNVK